MLEALQETAGWIRSRISTVPDMAVILGTGLGDLAESIDEEVSFPYDEIPHFPLSTVAGHQGRLIFGILAGRPVMALQGRFHYYEGYSMQQVTYPIRVMQLLGVRYLFLSNAAGGMNRNFQVGDIMLIADHINLFPEHPLRGQNDPQLGVRFPDMSEAYAPELRSLAIRVAAENNIRLQTGVYVGVQGPTFETPAEYRYFHMTGGDAIGMSTVPEVIVAIHAGMRVLAFSVITDLGIPFQTVKVTHEEVMAAAQAAQPKLVRIMQEIIKRIER
jgi:purine-nucleoside phosphorylase